MPLVLVLLGCGHAAPDAGCPAGTEARAGTCVAAVQRCPFPSVSVAGACVPTGQTAADCAEGFRFDAARAACLPVLPPASCPFGTHAIPGEPTCHAVAECPAARFPAVAGAVHVDAAAPEGGDGSVERPFRTVAAAVAVTPPAGTVAVAEGRYEESVVLEEGRALVGVCPAKVTLVGPAGAPEAVTMQGGGRLAGVSVTGPKAGVGACEGDLVLDHVWIHGTGGYGVNTYSCPTPTALVVRDSLIEKVRDYGVFGAGGTLRVERSTLRDTETTAAGRGAGARWQWIPKAKGPQDFVVARSLIERTVGAGLEADSVPLTLDGSVVRATRRGEKSGRGVWVTVLGGGPVPSSRLSRSYLAGNLVTGVVVAFAPAEIEALVIDDTAEGVGLIAQEGAVVRAARLVAARNDRGGAMVAGATLGLADALFVDNGSTTLSGQPFLAPTDPTRPTSLVVERARIEGGGFAGVALVGATFTARGLVVRGIRALDGRYGDGIATTFVPGSGATLPSAVDLEDVLVEGSARAGLGLFGTRVVVRRSRFLCNVFDIDVESRGGLGGTLTPSLVDGGDVACGCDALAECRATSADLAPITY